MDKDREKLYLIEKLLGRFPYINQRISGVKCKSSDVSARRYIKNGFLPYLKADTEFRQNGALGCWMAHANALESVREPEGITVVLEDDFVCKYGFFDRALEMIRSFDTEFDVIIFDPNGSGPLSQHAICPGIYDAGGCSFPEYMGSHCLFYNNKRVPHILDAMLDAPIRDFDGYLLVEDRIKTYVFYTGMSRSVYFYSDILGARHRGSFWNGISEWVDFVLE